LKRTNLDYETSNKEIGEGVMDGSSFTLADFRPGDSAFVCKIPTHSSGSEGLFANVNDVQEMYDNLSTEEKEFYWIQGTDQRFQGYNFLGKEPQHMLQWFARYIWLSAVLLNRKKRSSSFYIDSILCVIGRQSSFVFQELMIRNKHRGSLDMQNI
jgi:hypothetical protein